MRTVVDVGRGGTLALGHSREKCNIYGRRTAVAIAMIDESNDESNDE